MSNKDLFDDDDDFSETEEESPAQDSDEMSEDLSCESSSEEEMEIENNQPESPRVSLSKAMKDRKLYGPRSPESSTSSAATGKSKGRPFLASTSLQASPHDDSDDDDDFDDIEVLEQNSVQSKKEKEKPPVPVAKKRASLASKIRRQQDQGPIKIGSKRPEAEPKKKKKEKQTTLVPSKTNPKEKTKKGNSGTTKKTEPIDYQTIKKLKMENGSYRGRIGYVIKRGNVDKNFLLFVDKRRRGGPEKPKTITEQIKHLVESKMLKFRDLTYVYIENPEGDKGIFAAGLFTASGTIAHINATTIELPAYKSLYAEQSGKNHRQAKIKEVIACNNEQKDTDFVLQVDTEDGGHKMLQLRLPFLSTQAFLSIINEDKRVTKQRKNNSDKNKNNSGGGKSNPINAALKHLANSAEKKAIQVQSKKNEASNSRSTALPPFPEPKSKSKLEKVHSHAKESSKPSSSFKVITQGSDPRLKRKGREESTEAPVAPQEAKKPSAPDSPVKWPFNAKKRRIFSKYLNEMHKNSTKNFVAELCDDSGPPRMLLVDMKMEEVSFMG